MNTLRIVVAMLLIACIPAGVSAQDESERARVLFEQSAAAYQDGRFEAAAGMLEEAYRLDPVPLLLYNLARARESNGEDERAAEAYGRYLELEPEAENRGQIEARIRALTPEDNQSTVAEASRVPGQEETSGRPTWAPWLVAGLGAAVAGGGIIVGTMATSRASDAEAAANHEAGTVLAGEADGLATTSTILMVAGGAVVLTGVVWGLIWAATGDDEDREEPRVRVDPTGLRVRF